MLADTRTPHALRDGRLGSHQLGMAWSVAALLRSWPLADSDLHQASALTAEVAATAQRAGRLMSLALTPHQRSLHVAADEHDPEDPRLRVQVLKTTDTGTTIVVARQRTVDEGMTEGEGDEAAALVWFSLTVADQNGGGPVSGRARTGGSGSR